MFTIDGTKYDMPCKISRKASVRSSELSGYLLNGRYFNDAIATYLAYDVTLAIPIGSEAQYATLYEVLTNPVGEHTFVMPYGQGEKSFKGRITDVSDDYYKKEGETAIWRGTKFSVTATDPDKQSEETSSGSEEPVTPVQSDLQMQIGTVTSGSTAQAGLTRDGNLYTLYLTLPKGEKGDKGADGVVGRDGANGASSIAIGTVTTGAAGTAASATLTDVNGAYTLDLVIPRGSDGARGAKGADGAAGRDGSVITMNAVTLTAASWNSGVYSLETQFPIATYDIEVMPDGDTITAEQLTAWSDAQIAGSSTANQLKALGTVPTVDIPVIVKAVTK